MKWRRKPNGFVLISQAFIFPSLLCTPPLNSQLALNVDVPWNVVCMFDFLFQITLKCSLMLLGCD